jgi:thioredoxin reductase
MFGSFSELPSLANRDVCVVGGGPAGIAVALACEERGLSVLLLESGKHNVDGFYAGLSTGHDVDLETHRNGGEAGARPSTKLISQNELS